MIVRKWSGWVNLLRKREPGKRSSELVSPFPLMPRLKNKIAKLGRIKFWMHFPESRLQSRLIEKKSVPWSLQSLVIWAACTCCVQCGIRWIVAKGPQSTASKTERADGLFPWVRGNGLLISRLGMKSNFVRGRFLLSWLRWIQIVPQEQPKRK